MKNSLTPSGIEPATFRFVAQHFNHCATAVSTQYFASDKIKKNEMGVACGAYGGGERHVQGIGGESCGKKNHWGDPDADGRIILRWIFTKWDVGVMDWIEPTQDRDSWRALVNTVTNLRVP